MNTSIVLTRQKFCKGDCSYLTIPFCVSKFLLGIKSNYETLRSTVHGVNHNFRGMKDRKLKQFCVKGRMCYMSKHVLNEMSFDATIELLQNHELFIALL